MVAAAIVFSIAGCSRELPPGSRNNFHPYGVEHATLHLEYFGDVRGTEDFFIDSFGTREAHGVHNEVITPDGFHPTITCTVRTGSDVIVIDSVKQVEAHMLDPVLDSLYRLSGSVPSSEEQFKNYYRSLNYHIIGDTTVLGLLAHIWQLAEAPSYVFEWRGLIIGNKNGMGGHITNLRLLSVDTTSPIPPARFEVSHGFHVLDLTKMKPGEMPPPPQ